MIVSRLNTRLLALRHGLLASAFMVVGAVPAFAQDTATEQAPEPTDQPTSEQSEAAPKKPRTLYYLGERPALKRQEGPPVGKPLLIIPGPYVPKGSVLPPDTPPTEDETLIGPDGLPVEDGQLAVDTTELGTQDQPVDTEVDPDSLPNAEETFLEAGSLTELDPSGLAVLPAPEAFPRTFFKGYSRTEVMEVLKSLEVTGNSPLLRGLARKVALSGFTLPAPATFDDTLAFLSARLDLLAALGEADGYKALLARLPAGEDWSGLARHFANAYLLDGRLTELCSLAGTVRATDSAPYWIRVAAFCNAANANRAGVDFELEILGELTDVQPAFYQLVDRILVEATMPPGSVASEPGALSSPLKVDLLEAAMARLSRSNVPTLTFEGLNPLAVNPMLLLPGLSADAKTALLGESLHAGVVNTEALVAFARALTLTEDEQASSFLPGGPTEGFSREMRLLHLAASAPYETDRHLAVRQVWELAKAAGILPTIAPALAALTSDLPRSIGTDYPVGLIARGYLLAGERRDAETLFGAMRASPAGASEASDTALVELAPLMLMQSHTRDTGRVTHDEGQLLALWLEANRARPDALTRANLLFSLTEALGGEVPESLWDTLAATRGGAAESHTTNTALWRSFLKAVENKDNPAILVRLFALVAAGPEAISPALAGSLAAHLRLAGYGSEAGALSLEVALARGL